MSGLSGEGVAAGRGTAKQVGDRGVVVASEADAKSRGLRRVEFGVGRGRIESGSGSVTDRGEKAVATLVTNVTIVTPPVTVIGSGAPMTSVVGVVVVRKMGGVAPNGTAIGESVVAANRGADSWTSSASITPILLQALRGEVL
jgi:hypothetical protein